MKVSCLGCDIKGVRKDIKLHEKTCEKIPELCRKGCWQKVMRTEKNSHNCLDLLLKLVKTQEENLNKKTSKLKR